MSPKFQIIDEILQEKINKEKLSDILKTVVHEFEDLQKIMQIINDNSITRHYKKFLQKSLVVNITSILEIFYKNQFIYIIDFIKIDDKIINSLVQTEKVKVSEIIPLLKNKISVGSYLSEFLNFQNLNSIDKVFSKLLSLDGSYFDELKRLLSKPAVLDFFSKTQEFIVDVLEKLPENIFLHEYIPQISEIFELIRTHISEKLQYLYKELDFMIKTRHLIIHDPFHVPELENKMINNSFFFSLMCMISHIYLVWEKFPDYIDILRSLYP